MGPPPWPGRLVVGGSEGVPVAPATPPEGDLAGLGGGGEYVRVFVTATLTVWPDAMVAEPEVGE